MVVIFPYGEQAMTDIDHDYILFLKFFTYLISEVFDHLQIVQNHINYLLSR